MVNPYIPECGDIVWLEFDPQAGNEHKGVRPALALSPKLYNQKSGLCIFVPITSIIKYLFSPIVIFHLIKHPSIPRTKKASMVFCSLL